MTVGFTYTDTGTLPRKQAADGVTVTTLVEGGPDDLCVLDIEFAANSSFGKERHGRLERVLVLEGIFRDKEDASHPGYPAGTLIEAEPGSVHYPHSVTGCRILAFYEHGLGAPDA
ncbi:cupin domain-containing protein [Streptomyces sp. NPDC055140]